MNVKPEMQFIKWLAKLLEKYIFLINNMERMQQGDVQKNLDDFTSNWEVLQNYCEQHSINLFEYRHDILELERYHNRIVIYIKKKPRGFSNRYLEIVTKVIDEFLKFVHLPPLANLAREALEKLLYPPPSIPLLAPPEDEPIIHEEIGYRTDNSTTSGNYSTPPKTPEKYKKEKIPTYNNFYVTKLVLHQGALYKSRRGMLIELGMKFYDIEDVSCLMQITFWLAANDKAIMNLRSNTQVKLEKEVKPYTRNYDLSTKFFMSYSTLGLGTGLHKCKLKINASRLDNNELIGNTKDAFFELSDPS